MAEISAAEVKRLREKTGAGMMECKNALVSTDGDFDGAERLLKEKGLAALAKRADRATNSGRVFVKSSDDGKSVVMAEITCETDFVALNPEFVEAGYLVASLALKKDKPDAADPELVGIVDGLATKIRENMTLRRLAVIKAAAGERLASYVHGEGEIGVVVRCSSDKADDPEIAAFVFSLALHVAAFNPLALDRAKIDPAFVAEQEEIFRKQMEQDEKLKGKPANVLEGILKGKVNKLLSEICMMDQGYVKDDKQTVAQALAECSKKSGARLEIVDYTYFKVGT